MSESRTSRSGPRRKWVPPGRHYPPAGPITGRLRSITRTEARAVIPVTILTLVLVGGWVFALLFTARPFSFDFIVITLPFFLMLAVTAFALMRSVWLLKLGGRHDRTNARRRRS